MKTKTIFAASCAGLLTLLLIFKVIDFQTLKDNSILLSGWATSIYVWLDLNEQKTELKKEIENFKANQNVPK